MTLRINDDRLKILAVERLSDFENPFPDAGPLRDSEPVFSPFHFRSTLFSTPPLDSTFQEVAQLVSFAPVFTRTSVKR
jgi:hypothetical protein